jgi:hypothetical protein
LKARAVGGVDGGVCARPIWANVNQQAEAMKKSDARRGG